MSGISATDNSGTFAVAFSPASPAVTATLGGSMAVYFSPSMPTMIANAGTGTLAVRLDPGYTLGSVTQSGVWTTTSSFTSRSDTYTTTGNGVTISVLTNSLNNFAVQVKGTSAGATTWDVRLEGSLNGTDFTQIIQHTNTDGDGATKWSGSSIAPSLYIRSRCAGLVLGSASNIVVTVLGSN